MAQIKCPVNFPPPYLAPILTENKVQHHFRTPLAMLFPTVPDFIGFDEKKVEFEQFQNFCSKLFFPKNRLKFLPKVNLFCIISMSKLNTIEQLTTLG